MEDSALSITTIILTKNEEKNIEAAIESVRKIAGRIIVVDSGSTDNTRVIAEKAGVEVFSHEWQGHAAQFNWALDNCGIDTEWVFRLDADERVSEELSEEILRVLPTSQGVDGYSMRWRIYFMGKQIKHGGTHKPYFLRLFRFGKGRVENRLMDEHIRVHGAVVRLKNDLIHYDYKGLNAWLTKHIGYSDLELRSMQQEGFDGDQARKRSMYYRLPPFFRARLYYWYRYYLQLGFLDGREGKIFLYLQSYWYRFLIDAKLYEKNKKS